MLRALSEAEEPLGRAHPRHPSHRTVLALKAGLGLVPQNPTKTLIGNGRAFSTAIPNDTHLRPRQAERTQYRSLT
eukprot:5588638-Heterocapsa_arctica.AAC.1